MSSETPISHSASCLVQVRTGPSGQFTAQVAGLPELSASAATREEAVKQLRGMLQEQMNLGLLLTIELPCENPLMSRFGWARDDPTFDDYLDEIRKFREEVDRRENLDSGPSECSDTSLTPTT